MTTSFTVIGSLATTTFKFMNNIRAETQGILSFDLKKLTNCFDDLKIVLISLNKMFLLMLFWKRVLEQREDIPRREKTINNSLIGTACSTIFRANSLFKKILMHLSTKVVEKEFFSNTFK